MEDTIDIKAIKKDFRLQILKDMSDINKEVGDFLSKNMAMEIVELEEIKNAQNIMMFMGFGHEINTDYLYDELKKMGKNVYTSITDKENRKLIIEEVKSLDNLIKSDYGIREPRKTDSPLSPSKLDLVIVPGVAFDEEKNRLGYGGGFYDRFFDELRDDVKKIAICYDEQLLTEVPTEEHDKKVDMIITPSKTVK